MRQTHFTGQLYQLESRRQLIPGDFVEVNGPHDTYGTILKSEFKANGLYLNQIRGCEPRVAPIRARF